MQVRPARDDPLHRPAAADDPEHARADAANAPWDGERPADAAEAGGPQGPVRARRAFVRRHDRPPLRPDLSVEGRRARPRRLFNTNIRDLFGNLWPQYRQILNYPGTALDSEPNWETFDIDGAIDSVLSAPALPAVPLAVMSKTEPFATSPTVPPQITGRLEEVWPRVQAALVPLEPQTPHILATGSDHYVQLNDPDLTISTIRLVRNRAERGR